MAHVVTERCVDCRYTDCCTVCPVDCFYEVTSPAMLVIDPDTCIDCALCVPECPIQAIWPMDELPEPYQDWVNKNAKLFSGGTRIKTKKDALPDALNLAQLQAREHQRGWQITEPSGAKAAAGEGHAEVAEPAPSQAAPGGALAELDIPVPAGLSDSEALVYKATVAPTLYKWRTVKGVAKDTRLPQGTVQGDLERLVSLGHVRKQAPKTSGVAVYAVAKPS